MYILGAGAFAVLFIYDFNDWKLNKGALKLCFPVGCLMIIAAGIWFCIPFDEPNFSCLPVRVFGLLLSAATLCAEVYSLFFSFDRKEAYATTTKGNIKKRKVYTKGMYALCRHPGVIFFMMLLAGIVLATSMNPIGAAWLCVLDILLAIFEDKFVFLDILDGYREYKSRTPFLIPNSESVRTCMKDIGVR